MTLILLSITAVVLSRLSVSAFRKALDAQLAADELQTRWGAISCRAHVLPRAAEVLQNAEKQDRAAADHLRARMQLGRQEFELVLWDEQAKANVNDLFARLGPQKSEQILRQLVRANHRNVELHPHQAADARRFTSPGQIFSNGEAADLAGNDPAAAPVRLITCWGDGKVNFRRASREVISTVCYPELTDYDVDRLLEIRAQKPNLSASAAVEVLALTERAQNAARDRLTDVSNCYSLWIICRTDQRRSDRLYVNEGRSGASAAHSWGFEW